MKGSHIFERKTSEGIFFTEGEINDLVNCIDLTCFFLTGDQEILKKNNARP